MVPPTSPSRVLSLLRNLALALVATACIAPAANAATAPLFGFNDGAVFYNQADATTDAKLAKNAGSTADNIVVSWRDVEYTRGTYRWDTYDQIYNARIAQGIKPIFTVLYAPRWAFGAGVNCVGEGNCRYPPAPEYDADWRAFLTAMAKRYPKLAAVQVWNEPNYRSFWMSAFDPARYTSLVKQAYTAVKAVNPAMPVVAGALSNSPSTDPNRTMPYRGYLKAMYAAGLKGYADGISIHPYPADIDMWAFYKALSDVREVRDDAGDPTTKVWVTEVGVTTTDLTNPNWVFSPNDQAVMDSRLVQRLRTMPDVAAIVLHTLVEPTVFPATDPEYGYGIVGKQPGLVPKPAYCALAKLNATGYVCPAGVATNPAVSSTQNLRWQAQDLLQTAADGARAYRAATGSYYGLTPAKLRAYAPSVSLTGGSTTTLPGASADPSRMVIWAPNTGASADLWLCNTSKADRSYCIWMTPGKSWIYGMAAGPVADASRYTVNGWSVSW